MGLGLGNFTPKRIREHFERRSAYDVAAKLLLTPEQRDQRRASEKAWRQGICFSLGVWTPLAVGLGSPVGAGVLTAAALGRAAWLGRRRYGAANRRMAEILEKLERTKYSPAEAMAHALRKRPDRNSGQPPKI
jgi:hypothetical protein